MKRKSVTPEEWIRHRKLRKKIASAKWYHQKKQRELDEQEQWRQEKEAERAEQARQQGNWIWPDEAMRDAWYCVTAHLMRGYPSRRMDTESTTLYRRWCETIEADIEELQRTVQRAWPTLPRLGEWLRETWIRKIIRQMALRECRHRRQFGRGPFDTHNAPYPTDATRLWTTSVWYWIWLMGHLGNHREQFDVVWTHLHAHAARTLGTPYEHVADFLRSSVSLNHWMALMDDNLHTELAARAAELENERDEWGSVSSGDTTWSQSPSVSYPGSPERILITQPPTPRWCDDLLEDELEHTDSDSESLPSSLDTFLQESFAVDSTALCQTSSPSKT